MRIEKGRYYGNPNPLRAEYVLNRGEIDVRDTLYKGIKPGPNYRPASYDFGLHVSPNGVIEYKNEKAFGGKLKGMLMVVRYNNFNDVMILEPGGEKKDIVRAYDGLQVNLNELDSPLDLIEDTKTGNLYISEFGGKGKITLYKPDPNASKKPAYAKNDSTKIEKDSINENNVTLLTNEVDLLNGKTIYDERCAVCHGVAGEGGVGPNMTDEYWIYGSDVKGIFKTVKFGAKNGMQAWKGKISAKEMQSVSSYIISLQGTNPPNAKEPEGKKITAASIAK